MLDLEGYMPIYEYQCEKCQSCFERLVFTGDKIQVKCPECGAKQVKKLMSCSRFAGGGIGGACKSGASSGFS